MTKTIQCAAVEHLLRATARAEARHFWFRGFRAFVTPLLRRRGRGPAAMRACSIADAAPAPTSNCSTVRPRLRLRPDRSRPAHRPRGGPDAARARHGDGRALSHGLPSISSLPSMCCIRSTDADEQAAIAEMFRLLKPGGFASSTSRRWACCGAITRCSAAKSGATAAAICATRLEHAGFVDRAAHLHERHAVPAAGDRAAAAAAARPARARARPTRRSRVPPAPINALMTAVMHLEALWLRAFDAPFGSSLLCLARKPAGPSA